MKKEQPTHEAMVEPDERPTDENSRRDFLRQGSIGLASLAGAAALGLHPSRSECRRGSLRQAPRRDSRRLEYAHDARPGTRDGASGSRLCSGRRERRIGRRTERYGREGRSCAGYGGSDQGRHDPETGRPGHQSLRLVRLCMHPDRDTRHVGTIMDTTNEDCRIQYEGNFRSVWYALKALMPPLMKQGSGQIVINTSAAGARVQKGLRCMARRAPGPMNLFTPRGWKLRHMGSRSTAPEPMQ